MTEAAGYMCGPGFDEVDHAAAISAWDSMRDAYLKETGNHPETQAEQGIEAVK